MLKHYITHISCIILLFLLGSCAKQGNKNTVLEDVQKDSVQNNKQSVVLTDTDAILVESKRCIIGDKIEIEAHNGIYDVTEQMPNFPGGMSQLKSFIQNNLHYPVDAVKDGTEGRVILTFVVEKDGSLTDIKVAKSVSPSLDKEAVRIVKSMPEWIPGKHEGKKVRVKYPLPISFKLDILQP